MYDHEFSALSMHQSFVPPLQRFSISFFYPNNRSNPQRVPNLTSTAYSVPNNSSANRKAAKIKKICMLCVVHVPFEVRYTYISVKCSMTWYTHKLRYVVVWFVQKKKGTHCTYCRIFNVSKLSHYFGRLSTIFPSNFLPPHWELCW